uniref:non-specific serine/threonine protein kinase n=1 Tax=Arion vulgaris TaxID=1028688 RepID=A0A0B7A7U4_9EUPU
MPLTMWAKTAAGTNLAFVSGFGKAIKSWREILHQTIQHKVKVAIKTKAPRLDVGYKGAKGRCIIQPQFQRRTGTTLQSRIFQSVFSRTYSNSKSLAGELRRRTALLLSSSTCRNFRNVPIMSLIGVTLGLDISTAVDDSAEKMMSEMREKFRDYTWKTEPLEKLPQNLNDLDIVVNIIGKGSEGAVYKAKVKTDTAEPSSISTSDNADKDGAYDLAVKAVFNYGAESNSHTILQSFHKEIVPRRAEGCLMDTLMGSKKIQLPPHPNIVDMPIAFVDDTLVTDEGLEKFPAAMPSRLDPEKHFGRNKTLFLVMRRRTTHLCDYLAKYDITMETRCLMLAQLLEGVVHMGQNGIAHRDLKSDNVLVDVPEMGGVPHLEICDFGSCLAEENKSLILPFPTNEIKKGGNACLMAPEIITAVPGPNNFLDFRKSDLWAVGTIAYEILGGDNPFYKSKDISRRQLSSETYREEDLPPLPAGTPGPVKRLIKSILARDPKKRPSPSVAASVVQMVVLEGNGFQNQHNQPDKTKTISRKPLLNGGKLHDGKKPTLVSAALRKEREKFMWIMTQSLSMMCQLIFGSQSDGWDMRSVMNFLLLSRLTYADFKEAMKFL